MKPDVNPENGIVPGRPGLGRLGRRYGMGEFNRGPVGRVGLKYDEAMLEDVEVDAPGTPGFNSESIVNPKACDLNGEAIGGRPKELFR